MSNKHDFLMPLPQPILLVQPFSSSLHTLPGLYIEAHYPSLALFSLSHYAHAFGPITNTYGAFGSRKVFLYPES